jgi:hypothetical protein
MAEMKKQKTPEQIQEDFAAAADTFKLAVARLAASSVFYAALTSELERAKKMYDALPLASKLLFVEGLQICTDIVSGYEEKQTP